MIQERVNEGGEIEEGKLVFLSDADDLIEVSGSFTYEFSEDNNEVFLVQKGTIFTLIKD